jgi:hypothetical protein
MVRKPKRLPEVFSGYESFSYLLTELETVAGRGDIEWPPSAATAALHRLERLMKLLIEQIEQDRAH